MPERSGSAQDETAPPGVIIPLDVVPTSSAHTASTHTVSAHVAARPADTTGKPYSPERQRDWVRLIVTCGLLLTFGYIVVWATIESASYPAHWQQTKEMLQIILPALTGIIGTVIGFYFGTAAASGNRSPSDDL